MTDTPTAVHRPPFSLKVVGCGFAAVAAGVLLTGCELPDPTSTSSTPGLDTDSGSLESEVAVPPAVTSLEPWQQDLYRELTQPLPYSGGSIDGPCGSWEAATPQDAEKQAAIHRDCLQDPAKYGLG